MKSSKKWGHLFPFVLAAGMLSSLTGCFMPVNSFYETSRPLGKGVIEASGMITKYGSSDDAQTNIGFRAGIGLSAKTDLKIRYENFQNSYETGNYFSLMPKFSFGARQNWALAVPLSMYSVNYGSEYSPDSGYPEKGGNMYYSIAPTFLFTAELKPEKIDLTNGLRTEIFFNKEYGTNFGYIFGAGFSSDLNKWAIRPEIGMSFGEDVFTFNAGIGITFKLNRPKSGY